MYHQNSGGNFRRPPTRFSRPGQAARYPRFANRNARPKRTVKFFDPTSFVGTIQKAAPAIVHQITNAFTDFAVSDTLKKNVVSKGYTTPTPIQDQCIPHILQGRDLIGIANTGTGKTAAFLIPLIDKVLKDRTQRVLIVTPTRELADQINKELLSFTRGLGIYSVLCIGGTNMYRQRNDLRRYHNFVIGTPGRLKDLIETKDLILSGFQSVVLDEADHMVDIGFIIPVKFIISHLAKPRQSLFFSATLDGKVREILRDFVKDPVTVTVKTRETAQNVTQNIVKVAKHDKIEKLHDLLNQQGFDKVLIFGRTKWGVQKLSEELVSRGFRADAIHGDKRQSQRLRTLDRFKHDEIKILLATDVVARGLDIPDVSHVINFDMPESYESYVHRIGRTGRADKMGIALTFVEQ